MNCDIFAELRHAIEEIVEKESYIETLTKMLIET